MQICVTGVSSNEWSSDDANCKTGFETLDMADELSTLLSQLSFNKKPQLRMKIMKLIKENRMAESFHVMCNGWALLEHPSHLGDDCA